MSYRVCYTVLCLSSICVRVLHVEYVKLNVAYRVYVVTFCMSSMFSFIFACRVCSHFACRVSLPDFFACRVWMHAFLHVEYVCMFLHVEYVCKIMWLSSMHAEKEVVEYACNLTCCRVCMHFFCVYRVYMLFFVLIEYGFG